MKVGIEQTAYNSGVVGVSCKTYSDSSHINIDVVKEYSVYVKSSTYTISFGQFLVENGKIKGPIDKGKDIYVDFDIFEDPRNISDLDWQLLKIINPDIHKHQWKIFKLLKDLLDNKATEDDTVSEIKEVLTKYEI